MAVGPVEEVEVTGGVTVAYDREIGGEMRVLLEPCFPHDSDRLTYLVEDFDICLSAMMVRMEC